MQAHEANYRVYGARKIWRHLNRHGVAVARCTAERLMRDLGISGAVRSRKVITTIHVPGAVRDGPARPPTIGRVVTVSRTTLSPGLRPHDTA
ncbi:IS3 family transposase [Streptomyces sp. NPDC058642]|uniref:IS3 family transposase n=1 Tax=Streptomyces sp. NPDC058642 TaxID=3346572 RepID=UPI00364A8A27